MRTILWFIHFWIYLIIMEPNLLWVRHLAKKGRIEEHDAQVRYQVGKWAREMIRTAGGSVKVEGLERMADGPAVYVSNHLSYFDIPLVLGYLGDQTIPLVAKKQIQKIPMIRSWMKELHCVFIDRDNPRASMAALKEAEQWVEQGYSMVVFPEGTRSVDGAVHDFKSGAFRIAQKNKVPVVPFVIQGTQNLMSRDSLWIHPANVAMTVLPEIETKDFDRHQWRKVPEMARDKVNAALSSPAALEEHNDYFVKKV